MSAAVVAGGDRGGRRPQDRAWAQEVISEALELIENPATRDLLNAEQLDDFAPRFLQASGLLYDKRLVREKQSGRSAARKAGRLQ